MAQTPAQCPAHVDDLATAIADACDQSFLQTVSGAMTAAPPAAAVSGATIGSAIRQFGAAGMPIWTILAKAVPILLAGLAAGKSLSQIVADIIAAFLAGNL